VFEMPLCGNPQGPEAQGEGGPEARPGVFLIEVYHWT